MLNEFSGTHLQSLLQKREISNREVVLAVLDRIEAAEPSIRAFLTVRPKADLIKEADAVDARRLKGDPVGPLAGLPVAVKDNISTLGLRTTCASRILENYVPPYDATVITKIKAADGIILGKTNMDEFSMGSSTENSAFQVTRNPHNPDHVPGGTSGGSAAAIAAHETIYAIGSDTGGSIRQPASYCGAVGLKPTYGRVSRYGLVAYGSSLDQIGCLTKTVDDAALLLSVIQGHDGRDSTSLPDTAAPNPIDTGKPLRIGIPAEYFTESVSPETLAASQRALSILNAAGHQTVPVTLPHTRFAVPVYYIVACAEASSNLARYSGLLYGYRSPGRDSLRDVIVHSRSEGFGPEVRRRIILGTYVLSAGYHDAYYLKASKVRTLIRRDFVNAFESCDAILSPVAPGPAFRIGEKTTDPLAMYLVDILSVTANLAGLPAISVPMGKSAAGLPLSVQLTGRDLSETLLLSLARQIEAASCA